MTAIKLTISADFISRSPGVVEGSYIFLLDLTYMIYSRTAYYPDRLGPSGKLVGHSSKITCLEITGYRK